MSARSEQGVQRGEEQVRVSSLWVPLECSAWAQEGTGMLWGEALCSCPRWELGRVPSKSHRLTGDERPQARSQSDNGQALVGASLLRAVYMTQAWQPETLGASPPFACIPLPCHPPCTLAHSAAPASVPPLSSRLSFKSTHISGAAGCTPVPSSLLHVGTARSPPSPGLACSVV